MKLKVFLNKINQEMIDTGRRSRVEELAGCDIYVSWKNTCCVLDFSVENPEDAISLPMREGLMMRKEDVGGLIWDPKTSAVYQVDEEAYHALLDLDRGFSEVEVSRRMQIPLKRIRSLTNKLRRLTT